MRRAIKTEFKKKMKEKKIHGIRKAMTFKMKKSARASHSLSALTNRKHDMLKV